MHGAEPYDVKLQSRGRKVELLITLEEVVKRKELFSMSLETFSSEGIKFIYSLKFTQFLLVNIGLRVRPHLHLHLLHEPVNASSNPTET